MDDQQVQVSVTAIQQALGARDFRILVLETEVARLNEEIAALKDEAAKTQVVENAGATALKYAVGPGSDERKEVMP